MSKLKLWLIRFLNKNINNGIFFSLINQLGFITKPLKKNDKKYNYLFNIVALSKNNI